MNRTVRGGAAAGAMIALVLAMSGCTADKPNDKPEAVGGAGKATVQAVGDRLRFEVSPDTSLSAAIPGVGTIHGDVGAFTAKGAVIVQGQQATFDHGVGLRAAGTGVDLAFEGTKLTKPLALTFDISGRPSEDDVPVLAHQRHDGSWEIGLPPVAWRHRL